MVKPYLIRNRRTFIVISLFLFILFWAFFSNKLLISLFPEKVWAHRTNDLQLFEENANIYGGIELDVMFSDSLIFFDVYHPPAPSKNIKFEQFVSLYQKNKLSVNIWIDFKNLTEHNKDIAAHYLDSIVQSNKFSKNLLIIESTDVRSLQSFRDKDFKVAYYLPQELSKIKPLELAQQLEIINKELDKVDYLSTSYKDYYVLQHNFPNKEKLFWFDVYGKSNKIKSRYILYRILMDEHVNALLIPHS